MNQQASETHGRPVILAVDDDWQILHLLETYLHSRGFDVLVAGDAQQAGAVHEQLGAQIDLVLLDVQMPGVDGPGIVSLLRRANPRLRFCFMTGESGCYHPSELLAMGALEVFAKPFDLPALGDALLKMVQQPVMAAL